MDEIELDEKDQVGYDELYDLWYKCKKCGESNIVDWFNYCPMCGVKIMVHLT